MGRRIRTVVHFGDLRKAKVAEKLKQNVVPSAVRTKWRLRHLFDHNYWLGMTYIHKTDPRYAKVTENIRRITEGGAETLSRRLEGHIGRLTRKGDLEVLHMAVTYCVSRGFVDAPKQALIRAKMFDWAGAVEEGRGVGNTQWGTVINLYARAGATYQLRRIRTELKRAYARKWQRGEHIQKYLDLANKAGELYKRLRKDGVTEEHTLELR